MNFAKFLRTTFPVELLRRLLLGPFLGCQSMWNFSKNTIFSKMNIIFLGDAGEITRRCIFSGQGHLCFFCQEGDVMLVTPTHTYGKCHIFTRFLLKIISFHFPPKEKISNFVEKRNTIFPDITKKIMFSRQLTDHLFRTFEENIVFPVIFFGKIIFSFVSKE